MPASMIRPISPIRPMRRPRSDGATISSARPIELKSQLEDARMALAEAFEELKKVELLDKRDQQRERGADNAREQAELDRIGAMRPGRDAV